MIIDVIKNTAVIEVRIGPRGRPGEDGQDGVAGLPGEDGQSAYEIAVANGFVGTEQQWLDSLVGPQGIPVQDGQDGSPYQLATQSEMEDGTETNPRTMTPALIAAAITALSTSNMDLPLSVANGGTGADDADGARVSLGVEEIVPAVAQVVSVTIATDDAFQIADAYVDIPTPSQLVRCWFNYNGGGVAPTKPDGGRLLEVSIYDANSADYAYHLATALDGQADFAATAAENTVVVTNLTGGLANASNPSNPQLELAVVTTGADSYRRVTAMDGRQLLNVVAASLQGYQPTDFASAFHNHFYTQIANRPLFATTSVDLVTSSTALANLLSASVVSGKTYLFFATGLISTSATTEGSSIAINGPLASGVAADFTLPSNGIGGETNGSVTAFETKFTNALGPGAAARGRWSASGRFLANANGTFAIRVSAETGGANTVTWRAGSILILSPIN